MRDPHAKVVEAIQDLTAAALTAMDWATFSISHGGNEFIYHPDDAVKTYKEWKEEVRRGTNARANESKSDQEDVG